MPATAVGSVQDFLAGKPIAHQHPGDDETENGIDGRRQERHAEGQTQAGQHPGRGNRRPETIKTQAERPEHKRQKRDQHDPGQIEKREAQRQAKARQHMPGPGQGKLQSDRAHLTPGW
jgi:hypothetical protein